jgi:DNA repair exonuclease SbcCD ATPase subunit
MGAEKDIKLERREVKTKYKVCFGQQPPQTIGPQSPRRHELCSHILVPLQETKVKVKEAEASLSILDSSVESAKQSLQQLQQNKAELQAYLETAKAFAAHFAHVAESRRQEVQSAAAVSLSAEVKHRLSLLECASPTGCPDAGAAPRSTFPSRSNY